MLKRERAEDNAYVGSFPILIKITLQVYNTQFPIGDNHLNNHTNNVLAMLLQSCKHKKTRNSCRIKYTSRVASKLKSSISSDFS